MAARREARGWEETDGQGSGEKVSPRQVYGA